MQYIPIKTRVLQPPKDDIFSVLDESLTDLQEGDILLVTSKIVAIHQGRCLTVGSVDKRALIEQEADYFIEGHAGFNLSPLTIKHNVASIEAAMKVVESTCRSMGVKETE